MTTTGNQPPAARAVTYTSPVVEIRHITRAEVEAFRAAISRGFGQDQDAGELGPAREEAFLSIFPLDTLIAAFDPPGAIVATFGSFDLELTVPGGTLPMAGTTVVTVHPTHRRRGVLSRMMAIHLAQAGDRRQPLAGLWASEETIYGRFGYGRAAAGAELSVPEGALAPQGPDDVGLRFVTTDEARTLLPPVFDQVRLAVAGRFTRSPAWWEERHLADHEWRRDDSSALRIVVAERAGSTVGYVLFRQQHKWADGHVGEVQIDELVAVDDDARRSLWHFVTTVDLYPNVTWWNGPVDDPVLDEVVRFRRVTNRMRDTLWLRLLDVPACLEARTYERDGGVTLRVTDARGLAAGTYRLEVDGGKGRCLTVTADSAGAVEADVELDVASLGSLYLGGGSALGLARARRLQGAPEAVRRLDDLFHTARAPHCLEVF
jgi:predicted acetyltransferase